MITWVALKGVTRRCFIFLVFTLPVFAQPEIAPPNPVFERYLEALRAGRPWPITTPEGYYLGYVPEPVDLSHISGIKITGRESFPTTYDLRSLGRVTPVRNQGACGSCWAFATYGSLESWLLTAAQGSWDLSENNLKECHGFSWGPCVGGNAFVSAAYLSRRSGPLLESDDPYQDGATGCFPYGRWPGTPVWRYLRNVLFIPPRSGPLDNDNLKWAIMTYGAVMTSMYWDPNCYDPSDYTYYFDGTADPNHAVDLVGWDDNKVVAGAPGNGAWIVRNSWGSSWGESGYFYISYYDTVLGKSNAVFINTYNPDRSMLYQYDHLGWVINWGYGGDTAWAANVFKTIEPGRLTAVAFYASTVNTGYELYVKQGGPSGTVLHSQFGTIAVPGYHTVDLSSPVDLEAGVTFAVVIKFTTPGYSYPVPAEAAWPGYSDGAVIRPGESYISSDGTTWTDMSTLSSPSNACIKAIVSQPAKRWTVAVYLAADNNLGGGSDFMDFDEIEKGLTTSGSVVNVVVLWDKPSTDDTAIFWVQPDAIEGALAEYTLDLNKWYIPPGWAFDYSNGWPKGAASPSEENMGDPNTLTNFLNFVFYNFQSDYYALILWNHGGGWEPKIREPELQTEFRLKDGETWKRAFRPPTEAEEKKESVEQVRKPDPIVHGVCWDDTNTDYLSIKEVASGIANSSRGAVHNLGFDACLMQMLEVAYELRTVAVYMTGSEETEWNYGWAYHQIIAGITSTMTPLQLAQLWGNTRARWQQGGLDTISSVDLSKIPALAASVNALGSRLNTLLATNARYQEIMYAKLLSLCFYYNEFLDLDDFCRYVNVFVNDATAKDYAQAVRNNIANAVVAKANAPDYFAAGGISIYLPHFHDLHYHWGHAASHSNYTATNFAFCADYSWDEFINNWLATDYPDPYEPNNSPATAYNLGIHGPPWLVLHWEADFDDPSPDWYKFTICATPVDLWIYAWCTEYYSDTVIYLYASYADAQSGYYIARDDDGLHWQLGLHQYGSYLKLTNLPAGTYYLKVEPLSEQYGSDMDYEVWIGAMYTPTAAKFRVERETGAVLSDGSFYGQAFESGSADVAEWVPVSEPVEPGDVLELDPSRPGYYRKARGPCSSLVAGVVSSQPGVVLGHSEDTEGKALLALMGIVPVKVTDEGGPIRPGDLLVAASIPGYAMRWDPEKNFSCSFIGKALEPFEGGQGLVLVLLMR